MKTLLYRVLEQALARDWSNITRRMEAELFRLRRNPHSVPLVLLQELLVSGEDHRHGRHHGFDLIAIARAVWRRIARGKYEGASTIEQQLVRVITGRYERTLRRKVREIGLAMLLS